MWMNFVIFLFCYFVLQKVERVNKVIVEREMRMSYLRIRRLGGDFVKLGLLLIVTKYYFFKG